MIAIGGESVGTRDPVTEESAAPADSAVLWQSRGEGTSALHLHGICIGGECNTILCLYQIAFKAHQIY